MKSFFVLIFCVLTAGSLMSQAESYKAFEFELGIGYALASGDVDGGIAFRLEPRYNLMDNLSVGLRYEAAAVAGSDDSEFTEASTISSFLVTSDYYFGNGSTRVFGGLGVGIFALGSIGEGGIELGSKFGLAPRIGLELGHFRPSLTYNLITGTDVYDPSYLGLNIGFVFGGGSK